MDRHGLLASVAAGLSFSLSVRLGPSYEGWILLDLVLADRDAAGGRSQATPWDHGTERTLRDPRLSGACLPTAGTTSLREALDPRRDSPGNAGETSALRLVLGEVVLGTMFLPPDAGGTRRS